MLLLTLLQWLLLKLVLWLMLKRLLDMVLLWALLALPGTPRSHDCPNISLWQCRRFS
jgi:hypothetical protein